MKLLRAVAVMAAVPLLPLVVGLASLSPVENLRLARPSVLAGRFVVLIALFGPGLFCPLLLVLLARRPRPLSRFLPAALASVVVRLASLPLIAACLRYWRCRRRCRCLRVSRDRLCLVCLRGAVGAPLPRPRGLWPPGAPAALYCRRRLCCCRRFYRGHHRPAYRRGSAAAYFRPPRGLASFWQHLPRAGAVSRCCGPVSGFLGPRRCLGKRGHKGPSAGAPH